MALNTKVGSKFGTMINPVINGVSKNGVSKHSIPKIIHQIWLGKNKKPSIWMDSWKHDYCNKYPEWSYKLWTEKEINEFNLYNNLQFSNEPYNNGKSDIARYEILNRMGGVFMDADSLWLKNSGKSLDHIIEESKPYGFFAAKEPKNKQFYANGVIGSVPNHKILQEMISYVHVNYFALKCLNSRERDVWTVTGTKPFTDVLNRNYSSFYSMDHKQFYPLSFHQSNLNQDVDTLHERYPEAIMIQYGYTSNNILNNNVMKKFIDNNN